MTDREAKEQKLYDLLQPQAEGQYGRPGSPELESFMAEIDEQIRAMTDEELDQAIADNT